MRRATAVTALAVTSITSVAAFAWAQRMDPRRPATVVVGMPAGAAPMARVDPKRSAQSQSPLPAAPLKVAWRKPLSSAPNVGIEHAALVLADGRVMVITTQGEAVWLDGQSQTGDERARIPEKLGLTGPPVVLADGTFVVVATNGEVVGFTSEGRKWRTPLGGERALGTRIAPFPLPDGGVVVATSTELSVLDASGGMRARATLPEAIGGPLLAARGKVVAISAIGGVVYTWTPGREVTRAGSLGGAVDGGAAIMGDHVIVAMVDPGTQSRVMTFDLDTGVAAPRATAPPNQAYLGPPAIVGDVVFGLGGAPARSYVIALDASGAEKLHVPIPSPPLPPNSVAVDGGLVVYTPQPHVGVLVDRGGAIAFASPEGMVGVVDSTGLLSTVTSADSPCAKNGSKFAVAGLTPFGNGAFIVTCVNGNVLKIATGD